MSRSGSQYSVPRDANRVPFLVAASTADGITPVVLEADPTTHLLQVSSSGGGGGTQYTDGSATIAHPIGTIPVYDKAGTITSVSVANPLPVSASITPTSDTTQTGSITGSGQSVTFAVNAQSTVGIQVSGTFSGTILIKGSVDGSSYTPTTATSLSTGNPTSSITSSFTGQVNVAGFVSFQLTSVSWTSGTANISLRASTGISNIMLDNSLPVGTNSIGNVGLNAGSNAIGSITNTSFIATQATGTNLHTVVDSGTVTANIGTSGSLALDATLTGGTQQTKLTDGTNIVNVLKSDGTAAGQNAQLVAPAYKEVGSLTAGALNADLVPSTDVSGYSTFALQVAGTWVGTLTLQGSNDNTNFVSVFGTWVNNSQPVSTMTSTGIITGSCNFRYFRVRMTAYTSGTATGTLELKTVPFTPTNITGNIAGSVTATPVSARNTGSITTSSSSVASVSASGFSWAYVTISGTYAGISFGITASDNGGTTYYNVPVWDVQNQKYIAPGTTITLTDNSSVSYYVPQSSNTSVVRVLASAWTSGTGAVAISGMSNAPLMFSQAIQSFNSTASAVPTTALPVGFQARTTDITATTSTYNTIAVTDKVGKQVQLPYAIPELFVKGSASATGTTSTSLITAVASNSIYLTSVQVMNTGTVTSQILLQDGNAGTTLAYAQAPAGGGSNITFPVPIKNTSGNAWYFAAGSASSTIYVSAQGYYGV